MTAIAQRPAGPSPVPLHQRDWTRSDPTNLWTHAPDAAELAALFADLELVPVAADRPAPPGRRPRPAH